MRAKEATLSKSAPTSNFHVSSRIQNFCQRVRCCGFAASTPSAAPSWGSNVAEASSSFIDWYEVVVGKDNVEFGIETAGGWRLLFGLADDVVARRCIPVLGSWISSTEEAEHWLGGQGDPLASCSIIEAATDSTRW